MLTNKSENRLTHLLGAYNSESDEENEEEEVQERKHGINGAEDVTDNTFHTDWTQCFDRDTGHPYFWNIRSKEVTWDTPQEYSAYLEWVKKSNFSESDQRWKIYEAEDTKIPYYVDEVTRIVSWNMPEEYKRHLESQKKAPQMPKDNTKVKKMAQRKPTKQYPKYLTNYNSDDEKIELISSYGKSSDSSEESDSAKDQGLRKAPKSLAKREAQIEEEKPSEKLSEQIPNEELLPYKLYSHDSNELQTTDQSSNLTGGSSILFSNETSITLSELEKTYKVGSKSPEHPPISDTDNLVGKTPIVVDEEIDKKLTMRKRRIEIPRISQKTEPPSKIEIIQEDSESLDVKPKVNLYANFQSGGVEFTENDEKIENETEEKKVKETSTSTTEDEQNDGEDLKELSSQIRAKIKFLSEGRPIISGVQIMQIQLETLVAAFEAQHLTKYYVMNWLNETTKSLLQLENDVAPNGWRCKWDRANSCYYYQSLVTGRIQWDFPEPDVTCAGDEMEICTTPPPPPPHLGDSEPNVKKPKLEENSQDPDELQVPEPPAWNSSPEPPPAPSFDSAPPPPRLTDKFNFELDSFYSDLASLESPANPTEGISEEATVVETKEAPKQEAEPVLAPNPKNKKKKVKTSRTDLKEVSLMMAKWQKAQQDLKK